MSKKPSPSTIAVNKKARHLYELSDFVEAGISLTGPEVKSIRAGKINFLDSYVDFRDGEAFVLSLHIAPYDNAGYVPQDPDRPRRLLLHKREIMHLFSKVKLEGYAIIPLSVYLKNSRVKLEIALCKGKKLYDKRQDAAEKDARRQIDRAMKERNH